MSTRADPGLPPYHLPNFCHNFQAPPLPNKINKHTGLAYRSCTRNLC